MSGLFKGLASPIAGQALINGIVFGVYGEAYRRLHPLPGSVFWAGCCAGFVQTFICSPMELAKIRMQMQGEGVDYKKLAAHDRKSLKYTGSFDCLEKIFKTEGIRGINKGLVPTFIRETPGFGVYFASYEELCRIMSPKFQESGEKAALTVITAGGMAGIISWVFNYPVDVVKSRIQADIIGKYSGMIDCTIKSYQAEGWRVFVRGINSTVVRAFPTNAATFGAVALFSRLVFGDNTDDGHIR